MISTAGLWVDQEVSWAVATCKQAASTCLREWGSGGGDRRDFMIGCPFAAAVLSCTVQADRWIAPHLAVRTLFDYDRWSCRVTQPVRYSPPWSASWLPAIDKSRGSKSVEVQRVWEICDDRLQFMSRSLRPGLYGLVLLKLFLRMPIGFPVVLPVFLGILICS